jgi:predicted HD superfamily hydrolase involved in NAD metabolism
MIKNITEIESLIKTRLSSKRYQHTISVKDTALEIAKTLQAKANLNFILNEAELHKLQVAALLHDYNKELTNSTQLELAAIYKIKINQAEQEFPNLLHAKTAALLLEDEHNLDDPKILAAIKEHTLGSKQMSVISKILYLADMIEPGRDYLKKVPALEEIRQLIFQKVDLNQALLAAMNNKITYVCHKNQLIHTDAVEYRNHLLSAIKSKQTLLEF